MASDASACSRAALESLVWFEQRTEVCLSCRHLHVEGPYRQDARRRGADAASGRSGDCAAPRRCRRDWRIRAAPGRRPPVRRRRRARAADGSSLDSLVRSSRYSVARRTTSWRLGGTGRGSMRDVKLEQERVGEAADVGEAAVGARARRSSPATLRLPRRRHDAGGERKDHERRGAQAEPVPSARTCPRRCRSGVRRGKNRQAIEMPPDIL